MPALEQVLDGTRPLLGSLQPFLEELNPILEWLEYNQSMVSDFISNGAGALVDTMPTRTPQEIGHYLRQWGPTGAETLSAQADPRPGGRYHIVFTTPDGESHDISGAYRDADPHSLLSFTWMWKTLPDRASFVTLTFEDDGEGGTNFTLHHSQFYDEAARDRHEWGWTGALDKLVEMFADEN